MTATEWTYLTFLIVLTASVVFDLGLLSKRARSISIRQAFMQTLFWVVLAFAFFGFLWMEDGQTTGLEYMSAYLMEWGLSIDNIFVFILIFSYFGIPAIHTNRVLLLGILSAILLRVIFITVGVALVQQFYWVLYVFGILLVYTGIKMFFVDSEDDFDPQQSRVYKLLKRLVPITHDRSSGRFTERIDGRKHYTLLFVVMILLATTDVIFAFDSIPAVFAITQNRLVIYTSNVFAVLGLRSLFFLLKNSIEKFKYLKEGIATILVFIGLRMLAGFFGVHLPILLSLGVIVFCLAGAVLFSIFKIKSNS